MGLDVKWEPLVKVDIVITTTSKELIKQVTI